MTHWRLDAPGQTLVLAASDGVPMIIWWGPALPSGEDLTALQDSIRTDLTGGMLDRLPDLTLCPLPSADWQGQPGLEVAEENGDPFYPRLKFARAEVGNGALKLVSEGDGLTLTHHLQAHSTGAITLSATLHSARRLRLRWLSAAAMPVPQQDCEMIDVSGKWLAEFQLNSSAWKPGIRLRESRTGRSGQEHPPYAIFPEPGCSNTQGIARALHYAWSGGHRMLAEELPDGRRQVQFGHASGSWTKAANSFRSAELISVVSCAGLNGIGAVFQRDLRDRVLHWPDPARPRPVHYNCWEAVYFNHDLSTLTEIATRAAELGAERFVLDDGWFRGRNDDTSSLGDWTVDRTKWPKGLHPLIRHVQSLKMSFGLWVEPEMVNPDSDLFRAHPDWALGPADQTTGRNQMVLDMARAEVRDHLFTVLSAILDEYSIDYLKWDHNRLLPVVEADQTEGAYDLIDRLRVAHPGVEIESCASGGGRIDAGILSRTHRVWLSDCIDPTERLRIQHDAALFLPACVTGSHVGAKKAHTTGREQTMSFRARVAALRHFGFEMDLRTLTEEESAILSDVARWWKLNRRWLMRATILRLDSADPAVIAEMQMAEDGSRFLVAVGQTSLSLQILPRPVRLSGLDPTARYEVRLANPHDAAPQSRRLTALQNGPLTLTGQALTQQGLMLPVAWPSTLWLVEGVRLD